MNWATVRLAAISAVAVLLVVVILVSESVASAQSATSSTLNQPERRSQGNDLRLAGTGPVAYIFYTDTVGRDDFASFLSARGFQIDLVALTDTASFNFSSDRSIILGGDTGAFDSWGTPADVTNIAGSAKPVVGMGEGGYSFFGKRGLVLGYPNGAHSSNRAALVMDPTRPFFRCPNPVAIPPTQTLSLYSSDVVDVEIFITGTVPNGVTLIGSTPGDPTHYPVISQTVGTQNYLLWGFNGTPSAMTQAGRDLFINLLDPQPCAPLSNQLYLPLISRGP